MMIFIYSFWNWPFSSLSLLSNCQKNTGIVIRNDPVNSPKFKPCMINDSSNNWLSKLLPSNQPKHFRLAGKWDASRLVSPWMRRLSWYWIMKYSWLCWSLRRSFSVSWVNRRSSSKAWLICWYFWDMLSIMPPTGELDCQLQSVRAIVRQAQWDGGHDRFGNSKQGRMLFWWMLHSLYIIHQWIIYDSFYRKCLVHELRAELAGISVGLEESYNTKLDFMHQPLHVAAELLECKIPSDCKSEEAREGGNAIAYQTQADCLVPEASD